MKIAVAGRSAADIAHGMDRLGRPGVLLDADLGDADLIEAMEREGAFGLVHIGEDDPKTMLSYAEQCRGLGLEFSADPGGLEGEEAAEFLRGAKFLVTGQDDFHVLQATTGLSEDDILERVRVRVTVIDDDGVEIDGHGIDRVRVPRARIGEVIDPSGASGAFRAGLLAGIGWGMELRRAAEVGAQLAAEALESVGPRGYAVNPVAFVHRLEQSFGAASAAETSAYLLPE